MHAVTTVVRRAAVLTIAVNAGASAAAAQSPQGPWAAVDRAIGRVGSTQPGEVQRYSFPRSDLHVTLDGVTVKPALALGSWVAFKRMNGSGAVTAMGDLVLLEGEVTPVISKLQSMGVEETALHNHLQREIPAVMYLHIQAHGDPIEIARAIRAALALTRTPTVPSAAALGGAFDLDTARMASALGYPGKVTGGVYQVSVPRAEAVRMRGMELPAAMGIATALNFEPTGGGKAAITGDFVLIVDEVNPVIKVLREGGVQVTALHSHMLGEEPRLYFMHFWANDDATKLARTLRAALGHMNVRAPGT